jgi:hypothetical protein
MCAVIRHEGETSVHYFEGTHEECVEWIRKSGNWRRWDIISLSTGRLRSWVL